MPGGKVVSAPQFNELLWQQEAQQITDELVAKGYTELAARWKQFYPGFHRKHPAYSPQQVLSAFIGIEAAKGIGNAAQQAGALLGQLPQAAAKGAENAIYNNPLNYLKDIGGFFNALTQAHTWIRVAEFAVGGMLLYIGIRAMVSPRGTVFGATRAGVQTARRGKSVTTRIISKTGPAQRYAVKRAGKTAGRAEQRRLAAEAARKAVRNRARKP
jgi:hypothetical protein